MLGKTYIMDKVIFLDVDGVLNYRRKDRKGWGPNGDGKLAPECVALLLYILRMTGAKIVISSSWRHDYTLEGFKLSMIPEFLSSGISLDDGMIFNDNIIGLTIRGHRFGMSRGDEIQHWIGANNFQGNYAIIDDLAKLIGDNPNLFDTTRDRGPDVKTGLTKIIANSIIAHLNRS